MMRHTTVVHPRMLITAVIGLVLVVLGALEGLATADALGDAATSDALDNVATSYERQIAYDDYLAQYAGAPRPNTKIIVPAVSYSSGEGVTVAEGLGGLSSSVVQTDEGGYIEWQVNVPEAGLYNIALTYYPLPGRGIAIERALTINGDRLFEGTQFLSFQRVWGDSGPVRKDTVGNDVRPRQVEKPGWQTVYITDPVGYELQPYCFYLHEGVNAIRIDSLSEPMAVSELRLEQAEAVKPYSGVAQEYIDLGYEPTTGFFQKIQGEDAVRRSAVGIFAEFDKGDPSLEPYHPAQVRLNSIGGFRWQLTGEWVEWEFEVPEDGLYQIAIKGKQDLVWGSYSSRKLMIDGRVPFAEAEAIKFSFTDRYSMVSLTDEKGDPALVYLTRGKHVMRLEVTLGDLAHILERTENVLYELTTIYRTIMMVTSANPDPLRSYQLEKRIPGLVESLQAASQELTDLALAFETVTGQQGGHTTFLRDFSRLLRNMAARPDLIPSHFATYRDSVGSLGEWMQNSRNQPLQIDYIVVASPEQKLPSASPTLLQLVKHELSALGASFTHDYTGVHDISTDAGAGSGEQETSGQAIKVWIGQSTYVGGTGGAGRDQAQILKQMIEDTFTPETGIPVNLELISDTGSLLIPAIIAGTAPDVALGALNMDLAFRGAIADLRQFEDFEEVAQRFSKSAFTSMRIRDKVYGLPETHPFPVLFYRKDVLAELGLEVPQTWDDVYRMVPELQRNYMQIGLSPTMGTYLMLLYQKGVPLYKEDMVATNLDSELAIATLKQLTDLFRLYEFPIEFNAANRFRMGEMPLVIGDYGFYNQIKVFAPELRGEWGIAPVPGTVREDGTVSRVVPAGSSGAIILEGSKKKEAAWEFLKWWTRADTQARFGRELEALMGAAARYPTANMEALEQLPWGSSERAVLLEQWKWVEGTPPVLGGYYVTRMFDWLFRAVVLDGKPVRESVVDYDRMINEEIARKRLEFGYETELEDVPEEWKKAYWDHYVHLHRLDAERDLRPQTWRD